MTHTHARSRARRILAIGLTTAVIVLAPGTAWASQTVTLSGTNQYYVVDNCITTSYNTSTRAVAWEDPSSCSGDIEVRGRVGTYSWTSWASDPVIATVNSSGIYQYQVRH